MGAENGNGWAGTADDWIGRTYDAVLPSGMQVTFRLPSLGEMAAIGELPSDLLDLALAEWSEPGSAVYMVARPVAALPDKPTRKQQDAAEKASREVATRLARLNRHVVASALVTPKLTAEELQGVPYRDVEMLSQLVNRGKGIDAAGRHVGVVPIDQFRIVAEEHSGEPCAPDCAPCQAAGRRLSALHR
jgi:hypothetical protein